MDETQAAQPLADRDVRLLARLFDRSLVLVTAIPMVAVLAALPPERFDPSLSLRLNLLAIAAGVGLALVQWVLLTLRGQSLGKLALGIRIERPDGSLPGFFRAVVLRDWLFVAFTATGVLGIVDGMLIFAEDRRTLHDRLADTRVVFVGRGAS
ncbi:MAG: RDD family protein [Myxococcota bacterium]